MKVIQMDVTNNWYNMNQEPLVIFFPSSISWNTTLSTTADNQFTLGHSRKINVVLLPKSMQLKSTLIAQNIIVII